MSKIILNHCRLLPELSGGVETAQGSVVLQDGKIFSVSARPADQMQADASEEDAQVFDCGGKTLLPGLIDLHTHMTLLGGVAMDRLEESMGILLSAQKQAAKYLDYGFTTIRDCGSIRRAAHYVRDGIGQGLTEGPDVLSSGMTVTSSAAGKKDLGNMSGIQFSDGADQVRRAVREEAANLADFIKIYASGSAYNPTGVPKHPIMTAEEIRAAVETAKMNGLSVAAHCHADAAIRCCAESGVRTLEHATYLSEETLKLVLDTPDCYLVPTFSAMYVSQTDPEERAFWLARLNPMLDHCAKAIEKAYQKGAVLGFGTDSAPGMVQYEKGVEFEMRKEQCHMENIDILLQATRNNARIAGLSDRGEIKAGLKADLILTDGDPKEDFSVMYQKPARVFKDGRQVR